MHGLKPCGVAIPRGLRDHRTPDGRRYGTYLVALLARLGPLSSDARPTLVEAGRCAVELEHLAEELEQARARRRRRDMNRIRRSQFACREQMLRLERRLEELAGSRPPEDPRDLAAAFQKRAV